MQPSGDPPVLTNPPSYMLNLATVDYTHDRENADPTLQFGWIIEIKSYYLSFCGA